MADESEAQKEDMSKVTELSSGAGIQTQAHMPNHFGRLPSEFQMQFCLLRFCGTPGSYPLMETGQERPVAPVTPSALSLAEIYLIYKSQQFPQTQRLHETATGKELWPDVPELTEAWCRDDLGQYRVFSVHWDMAWSLSRPLYFPCLDSN